MSSLPSILEGSVAAKVLRDPSHGTVEGAQQPRRSGTCVPRDDGSVSGEVAGTPENAAISELGNLISSLGTLSAQAQSLPLSAPTLPGLPQGQTYRPQATDYTQFVDESN